MMQENTDKLCRFHINADSRKIVYLNGILDSYEGLAMMRTADEITGEIVIYTTESHKDAVQGLLDALSGEGVKLEVKKVDFIDEVY